MKFEFAPCAIPDVILITHEKFGDDRGFFAETYREAEFAKAGVPTAFVQENHSRSAKGILRGLHYQNLPKAQGKLVRCVRGSILDVAVDIRCGSPYYGKHVAVELSEASARMLYIPVGFAHGFCSLSDCDVVYKQTDYYSPPHEGGICWDDPALAIPWPTRSPGLSAKDAAYPFLKDAAPQFDYKK